MGWFGDVMFFIAAIVAIAGAVGVVMLRNPFYNVLALVCHLVALAALFMLLRAEFVAAAQVVVYAGAVMVLYVFVVAYVGGADEPLHHHGAALKVLGPVFGLFLAVELFFATLGSALSAVHTLGPKSVFGFGTPEHIGKLFLTTYLFPFEVASLLLMVAAVGAVVLARRRRGLEGTTEGEERRFRVARPIFTGTMHETTGIRGGGGTTTQGASGAQTEPIGDLTGQQAGDGRREPAGAGDSRSKGGW